MPGEDTVEQQWARIQDWLRHEAPVAASSVRPPARAENIHAVQAELGETLPNDLIEWWQLTDGFALDNGPIPLVPSLYMPLDIRSSLTSRQFWIGLDQEMSQDDPDREPNPDEAGTPALHHSSLFLPLAIDGGGSTLFVDLRPGPRHGCVIEWVMGQEFTWAPLWDGVTAMLLDIGHAMEDGVPVLREHVAEMQTLQHPAQSYIVRPTDDNILEWIPAQPHPETCRPGFVDRST